MKRKEEEIILTTLDSTTLPEYKIHPDDKNLDDIGSSSTSVPLEFSYQLAADDTNTPGRPP